MPSFNTAALPQRSGKKRHPTSQANFTHHPKRRHQRLFSNAHLHDAHIADDSWAGKTVRKSSVNPNSGKVRKKRRMCGATALLTPAGCSGNSVQERTSGLEPDRLTHPVVLVHSSFFLPIPIDFSKVTDLQVLSLTSCNISPQISTNRRLIGLRKVGNRGSSRFPFVPFLSSIAI